MIQKISATCKIAKRPLRFVLNNIKNKTKVLAGSSMSGYNPPIFHEVEMVIPGGLGFKEKAYYLLKGKLPHSVYERWFPNDGEHVLSANDQLVTVKRTYEGAIGGIVEGPHGIDSAGSELHDAINTDLANHISSGEDYLGGGHDDSSGGDEISSFEIWKHLAGFQ